MIWPLAAEYAKRGWAVRRAGWANPITSPFNASSSLRWVVYQNGLFHLTYIQKTATETMGSVSRVVRNTDFGVAEFHANDWTVYSTNCQVSGGSQQGKLMYPGYVDDEPYNDPFASLFNYSGCPDVPPIEPPSGGGDDGDGGGGGGCDLCPPPPFCGPNFKLDESGRDACNCRTYICQPTFCGDPPECPTGYRRVVIGYDELGCARWECRKITTVPCGDLPECSPTSKLVIAGSDARGCPIYICQPLECPDVIKCPDGYVAVFDEPDAAGCPTYTCVKQDTPCGDPLACPEGSTLKQVGVSAEGCAIFECEKNPNDPPVDPNDPGGGGGGGGSNGDDVRPPTRPRTPPCQPAQIYIEGITKTPPCFQDGTAPPFKATYGFTIRLGPAQPCADGIYWVTININGKTIRKTMSPGDGDSYSELVEQSLGGSVRITANAYLPIKGLQSNASSVDAFPSECPPCAGPPSCPSGTYLVDLGQDSNGSHSYECQPCGDTPSCPSGSYSVINGTDSNGCPTYECQPCDSPPSCPSGEYAVVSGTDSNGCPTYKCCPEPPTCEYNKTLVPNGIDANGCEKYICKCTSLITTFNCASIPRVDGFRAFTLRTVGYVDGCSVRKCCPGSRTSCPCGDPSHVVGTWGGEYEGCPFYVCNPEPCG